MELKGSKTEANLWEAFAGESQARNKYTYYASKARKDGFEQIAAFFEETANNEKEHAKLWFKELGGIGTTAENLMAAAEGEHEEWTSMYKRMAEEAREEGFHRIADMFAGVGEIEKSHYERYLKLVENLENDEVFKKSSVKVWYCRNCGHLEYGDQAPEVCPVCSHPQAFFACGILDLRDEIGPPQPRRAGERRTEMRAMLSGLLAAVLLLSLAACGQQETEPDTLGQSLLQAFQTAYEADPQADLATLAQGLLTQETVGFQGTTAPVEPGTLMGFGNTPIEGFSQGVMFAPVIGTIPFLGYLFRLEEGTDGAAFVDTLQSAGDLRWNICTQADEMVVHQEGDVVFFLMCPYTLEAAPQDGAA